MQAKKSITQAELGQISELHQLWLEGKPGGQYADFSDMNLINLTFERMDFEAVSFRHARISNCNLSSNFTGANFRGAELRDSYMGHCSFEHADFTDTECHNCDFTRAQFDGARLRRAHFKKCLFVRSKLECCDMTRVNFDNSVLSHSATMGSWGDTPPARNMKTLLAEETFKSSMMELSFWDRGKIAEWMDEAWSQAQDQTCGYEPKPGPREPEYRELLESYAANFVQVRKVFPAAAKQLFSHGESFAPEELHSAAVCLAQRNSMHTVLSLQHAGLLRPDNAGDLAQLKEAADLIIEDAFQAAENGQVWHGMVEIKAYYHVDDQHELSLYDLLRDRAELADVQIDFHRETISLEINTDFLPGMTMGMQ